MHLQNGNRLSKSIQIHRLGTVAPPASTRAPSARSVPGAIQFAFPSCHPEERSDEGPAFTFAFLSVILGEAEDLLGAPAAAPA